MSENAYVEALSRIPRGETRTYAEIAALAGRPSGARAAGRAVSCCPTDARTPWHRAVRADGALSIDPDRAQEQIERLRRESARPKTGESVARWSRRVGAAFVGSWRSRRYLPRDDPRLEAFDPLFVERFANEEAALERHFAPFEADGAERDASPARGPTKRAPEPRTTDVNSAPRTPSRTMPPSRGARTRAAEAED